MFRIDRATEVSLALVVSGFVLFAAAMQQKQSPKAIQPVAQVTEQATQVAATSDDSSQDEEAAPVPPEAAVEIKRKVYLNADSFDQSFFLNVTHQEDSSTRIETPQRYASLPRVVVTTPEQEPKKVPTVWTATLEEREEIARNYLIKRCPNILSLEKMQSAQSKKETDARFMAAKSPGGVIGSLLRDLRSHDIVVGQMCPTEFYNMLFAKKQ